jgi:hypothetical protein
VRNEIKTERSDDICFILDQHTEFDVYCTNSLKQQSAGSYRNVASLDEMISVLY